MTLTGIISQNAFILGTYIIITIPIFKYDMFKRF